MTCGMAHRSGFRRYEYVYCICSRVIGDPFSGSTSMYYVLWLIEYVVAHRKGQAGSLCYIVNS